MGSQFICKVGFEFLTMGSSLSGILTAPYKPHEFLSSPLQTSLYEQSSLSLSLSLSLYFYSRSTPHSLYSLLLFIAWGWWGVHDCILASLVWAGSDLIILAKEYASLETMVVALVLVPASNRLLNSDTPQGNPELLRSWVDLSKCILDQVIPDCYGLTYHASKTKSAHH